MTAAHLEDMMNKVLTDQGQSPMTAFHLLHQDGTFVLLPCTEELQFIEHDHKLPDLQKTYSHVEV